MARRPSLMPLQDVLVRALKAHGMQTLMLACSLQQHWTEIVGDQVGRHSWPDSIRHRKLYLVAENSVWMQQLRFLKPELLAKINAACDGDAITDIVLRVGSVASAQDSNGQTEAPNHAPSSQELNGDQQAAIDASVRPVADPDLRERLRSLLAKSLKT